MVRGIQEEQFEEDLITFQLLQQTGAPTMLMGMIQILESANQRGVAVGSTDIKHINTLKDSSMVPTAENLHQHIPHDVSC